MMGQYLNYFLIYPISSQIMFFLPYINTIDNKPLDI